REAVRVDHAVARAASRVGAVLLEAGPKRLRLLALGRRQIRLDARRRRRGRRAHQLLEHPSAAQDRGSAITVRRAQQHGALAEQSPARRVVELDSTELRTEYRVDAVVTREPLVEERVARGQERSHVAILEQNAAEEKPDLLGEI